MTQAPTRLAIHGASGRMGQALLRLLPTDPRFTLVAALVGSTSTQLGRRVAHSDARDTSELQFSSVWAEGSRPDVVLDFSSPAALPALIAQCRAMGTTLVSGTTGLDAAVDKQLTELGKVVPVLWAANFSIGIALLLRLVEQAAVTLAEWDCEILEAHHRYKEDAPSGTALALGKAIATARGTELDAVAQFGRHGKPGPRGKGQIGFSVLRAGDIAGEHSVLFGADGERLELTHRASDRDIFARGALHAAARISQLAPGRYSLDSLL